MATAKPQVNSSSFLPNRSAGSFAARASADLICTSLGLALAGWLTSLQLPGDHL